MEASLHTMPVSRDLDLVETMKQHLLASTQGSQVPTDQHKPLHRRITIAQRTRARFSTEKFQPSKSQ